MRKFLAVAIVVFAVAPATASAHNFDYTELGANDGIVTCNEAIYVAAVYINRRGYHGGYLRANCLQYGYGYNGLLWTEWRLGVRAKDNALLTCYARASVIGYNVKCLH